MIQKDSDNDLKKDREISILKTIFSSWGEYRAIETDSKISKFKWECLQVYLEGIESIIKNEQLDQWILVVVELASRRISKTATWKNQEEKVIVSLLELWFQILWLDFDPEEKLIVIEGLELQIGRNKWNDKILYIIDYLRKAAEESSVLSIKMKHDRDRVFYGKFRDDNRKKFR